MAIRKTSKYTQNNIIPYQTYTQTQYTKNYNIIIVAKESCLSNKIYLPYEFIFKCETCLPKVSVFYTYNMLILYRDDDDILYIQIFLCITSFLHSTYGDLCVQEISQAQFSHCFLLLSIRMKIWEKRKQKKIKTNMKKIIKLI